MRVFKKTAAQGDIYIRRIEKLPENAIKVAPENGKYVVAHSETGHHHTMVADRVTMYTLPDSIMDCLLVVDGPTTLDHERSFDTHEPLLFGEGIYHVRRQREYVPEGFRRVQD